MHDLPSVFLSYSTIDREAANAILTSLERSGILCWIAPRDVHQGEAQEDAIIRGISNCKVVLCLLSSSSNKSRQVQQEIHYAFEMNPKPVVPVRLQDIQLSGALAYHLTNVPSLDASSPPLDRHLLKIEERVRAALASSARSTSDTARVDNPIEDEEVSPGLMSKWTWRLLLSGAGLLIVCVAAGFWRFHRPLSSLQLSLPKKITHDGRPKDLAGTDGKMLYFSELSPNSIDQVAIGGGPIDRAPVSISEEIASLFDISPDGTSLLVASGEVGSNSRLLLDVPIQGGAEQRFGYAQGAAFSTDGRSIASITEEGDFDIVRTDGKEPPHKLGNVGRKAYRPAWSHDDGTIRFDQDNDIWEIPSDGSKSKTPLADGNSSSLRCCGRWTPDGKLYLFIAGDPARWGGQIWALDGRKGGFWKPRTEPVQLTNSTLRWKTPIASKDGKTVFAVGMDEQGKLSRLNPQTKQLEPFLKGISAESVTFSKDRKSVAYVKFPQGTLWKASADGTNEVPLTYPPIHPEVARWSPDGSKIAFVDVSTPVNEIYFMPSDGGTPQRILPNDNKQERGPNWSQDSEQILFASGDPRDPNSDLRILDLAHSGIAQEVPGSRGYFSPRWSPDSKYIVAIPWEQNSLKIYSFEKKQWTTLAYTGSVNFPTWSSDSQWIYYLHYLEGKPCVFRIKINGGKPELFANLHDTPLTGRWNYWMELDPTNAPLVLVDAGIYDIYAMNLEER